jgi:hypothetical protein
MIPVPLLNPDFATSLAARWVVRSSGSGHQGHARRGIGHGASRGAAPPYFVSFFAGFFGPSTAGSDAMSFSE